MNKLNIINYIKFNSYLSPAHAIPNEIKKLKIGKKYTILYDLMPVLYSEYYPDSNNEMFWHNVLINSLNSKDYYFAISEYTRRDFLKHYTKLDANKVFTTLLASNESFKKVDKNLSSIKQKYNIPQDKKYIFSLCTLEPRKNLIRAVKTFIDFIKKNDIDDMVFVLGGGQWDFFIEKLDKEIEDLGMYKDKVIKAGYIDDKDLPALYTSAEWFVYTSQYEGFGLPPLEAMSCGCPVITSNNSSLPEVVGDAGIMIDWDSDEQHIKAYEKYYFEEAYRNEMAHKGLERSTHFSWEKCVTEMVNSMKGNK